MLYITYYIEHSVFWLQSSLINIKCTQVVSWRIDSIIVVSVNKFHAFKILWIDIQVKLRWHLPAILLKSPDFNGNHFGLITSLCKVRVQETIYDWIGFKNINLAQTIPRIDTKMKFVWYLPTLKLYNLYFMAAILDLYHIYVSWGLKDRKYNWKCVENWIPRPGKPINRHSNEADAIYIYQQ